MAEKTAQFLGFDLSTSALSVGVRGVGVDRSAIEDFVAVRCRGATQWHGQPCYDLDRVPQMLTSALWQFEDRGWSFSSPGKLSCSVRQHDMVLMDDRGWPAIPALTWECHIAETQVGRLRSLAVDDVVGPIEPRFVLPKLLWALEQEPELARQVRHVALTGDWIAAQLTGNLRLSASDALSNALLDQRTKELAADVITRSDLDPNWFPPVIASGAVVGTVDANGNRVHSSWQPVCDVLSGWTFAAGLGDNHASAVGCGLTDVDAIVISAGSSGTVVRLCTPQASLAGNAACFEYYDDRLLLMMLAECALWYNDFIAQSGRPPDHAASNESALAADPSRIVRVKPGPAGSGGSHPEGWQSLDWPSQVASTQFSIALEMLMLVRGMLSEVVESQATVRRFIVTGGLSQAPLFGETVTAGLARLVPAAQVMVSQRTDRLAFQSATYGALINAMTQGQYDQLPATIADLCPLQPCATTDRSAALDTLLATYL